MNEPESPPVATPRTSEGATEARELARRLADVGLFGGLSEDALSELARTLRRVHYDKGAFVFQEGEAGREIYVVLEGTLDATTRRRDPVPVRSFGPGDAFGAMSLIDVQARSVTVRATSDAELVRLTSEDLDALYRRDIRSYAMFVLNVARDLSRRLRACDDC